MHARRLPRPRGTHDGYELPGGDIERHAAQRWDFDPAHVVGFRYIAQEQQAHRPVPPGRCCWRCWNCGENGARPPGGAVCCRAYPKKTTSPSVRPFVISTCRPSDTPVCTARVCNVPPGPTTVTLAEFPTLTASCGTTNTLAARTRTNSALTVMPKRIAGGGASSVTVTANCVTF